MKRLATRVIIVRHGQSTYNAKKIIQGRCDESVLTEQGMADAKTAGQALSQIKIDAFYCSPLQRAKQTSEIIYSCLNNPPILQPTEQLMEIDLPLWEKLQKQEVLEKYPQQYHNWKQEPHQFKMVLDQGQEH